MALLFKQPKTKSGKKNGDLKDGHDSSTGAASKVVVSRLMPRHDDCWWDPDTKNWIAPQMHKDFLNDLYAELNDKERKDRIRRLQKKMSWVCQLTPSNRSTCRRCGEFIAKQSYRVGYPIKDRRGDYFAISNWLHLKCAGHAFYHEPDLCRHIANESLISPKPNPDSNNVSSHMISLELLEKEMVNFADLKNEEKQMICDQLQPLLEAEDEEEKPSKAEDAQINPRLSGDLNVTMLKFQEEGLYWMKTREDDANVNGGILADEMGMGKTIQMISLILEQKFSPTLVVCPTAAVLQWRNEILRCTEDIEVRVYHGCNRSDMLNDLPKSCNFSCNGMDYRENDKNVVVLTTYQTMEYDYRQIAKLNKVACEYCGRYFLPPKLAVHLQYYCGPDAELTEKQKKTERKSNAVKMLSIGGNDSLVNLSTLNR